MAVSIIKQDNNSFRKVDFANIKGTLEGGGLWNSGKIWVINARVKLNQNISPDSDIVTLPFTVSGYTRNTAITGHSNDYSLSFVHNYIGANKALSKDDIVIMSGVIIA